MRKHHGQHYLSLLIAGVLSLIIFLLAGCISIKDATISKTTVTSTQYLTNTLPPPTKTSTVAATHTPTKPPTATPTPIKGSFENPLVVGETISVRPNPNKDPDYPDWFEMECTLVEYAAGERALNIAIENGDYSSYSPLIEGQEYLAVYVKLKLIEVKDPNNLEILYPYWSLTLRYQEEGDDLWSEDYVKQFAQGYVPIEGEGWVFFRIKQGSKPFLYFSPFLIVTEQVNVRNTGVYFRLFN